MSSKLKEGEFMSSKLIVEQRLKEAKPDAEDAEDIDLSPETPFDKIYKRILDKIDKKPTKIKLKLYKSLLDAMVSPLSTASTNRIKLTTAAREFLKNFSNLSK